ncbi:MAG: hypothetical protein IJM85_03490 [Clostridia bacterium]|nr:hypothetical protein [Clostridia bacterium]
MKKILSFLLILCLLCGLAACSGKPGSTEPPATAEAGSTPGSSEKPTKAPKETPAPTGRPSPVPVTAAPSTPEPDARAIAALHGLDESDLRGEYALFLRFSQALEANRQIDEYRDLVYKIFPVIADAKEYLDEDYFFPLLSRLTIEVEPLDDYANGMYFDGPVSVSLSQEMMEDRPWRMPGVLFHELMHFVDFGINGRADYVYLLDGRHVHQYELNQLSPEEQEGAVLCGNSDIVKEGCAELFTVKYFSDAVSAYFGGVSFMTGIEYIMGEEFIKELFFRWDSGAVLEELFCEVGYTHDEYWKAAIALAALANCYNAPYDPVSPEDLLIDLYEYKLGGGWREDEGFLYILKCINGIAMDGWKLSKHADFLKTIEFRTWEQYNAFSDALLSGVPEAPDLAVIPPTPFMQDGKLLVGDLALATDPQTGESFNCAATFDYDFAAGRLRSYKLTDLDAYLAENFPGIA